MRSTILSAVAMATTVSAHAQVYGVWVNGEDQGDGRNAYIRSPDNNSPVKDLASPDIVCNVNGGTPVPEFVSVAAGDSLAFEWYHNTRADDIIDASHQGPIITWIAEYTDGDGTGAIWTKIAEDGFDGSEWAVAKLIANGGMQELTIPESLAAGQYLVRQEIIAHHESDTAFAENPARGAQFYPSCVQVEVAGDGNAVPDQGFDFNADYTYEDAGIVFNLYDDFTSYEIPGPEVWDAASGGSSSPVESGASSSAPAPTPTGGVDEEDVSEDASPVETEAPSSTEASAPIFTDPIEDEPVTEDLTVPSATEDADPVATDAPSSTEGSDPAATSPVEDEPETETPSEGDDSQTGTPSEPEQPIKAPATGCKAKRRVSMKRRISSNY